MAQLCSRGAIGCPLLIAASFCDVARVCPLTPESVASGSFSGIGEDTVVFTGYVIRYVDSPDAEFRGYDVSVVRWLKGSASPEGAFLRV